eukprot:TRINITY_DN1233_c3_g1_i1.p1 TRINITY_DN1233_c3_g1~~TRINITY_DN1233_c3_g1_i1.p1  ORF type:complete len:270 (-),score=47.48 TRINITY_DN1233_c3_g1_i1:399-1208(-)
MSSFAATIFIASLVTVGVLLITLVITLAVMLQECQNKSAGLPQLAKTSDEYDYCKIFALHAELNNLRADEFPAICKEHAIRYIKEGGYRHDMDLSMRVADNYFSTSRPNDDGLDVVLMDADDIMSLNLPHDSTTLQYRFDTKNRWVEEAKQPVHMFAFKVCMKLRSSGWPLIFFTRKPEKERNSTIDSLVSAGYGGWSSLIMRSDDELQMESWEYISGRRVKLHNQGFRIASVISSRMDALMGPCLGVRNFKLIDPIYYDKLEQHIEFK